MSSIIDIWVNWFPKKLVFQRRLINRVAPVYRQKLQRFINEEIYGLTVADIKVSSDKQDSGV